jgi:hypothetical protein
MFSRKKNFKKKIKFGVSAEKSDAIRFFCLKKKIFLFLKEGKFCKKKCYLCCALAYLVLKTFAIECVYSVDINEQGILRREKYHCMVDLLFDWFGLVCFANKNKKLSVVIQLIPNQSNRRPMVQ